MEWPRGWTIEEKPADVPNHTPDAATERKGGSQIRICRSVFGDMFSGVVVDLFGHSRSYCFPFAEMGSSG